LKDCSYKLTMMAHVLILPFPTQGHINPMLQFGKDLVSKGLKVTLATTSHITNSIKSQTSTKVSIASISDGYDEGGPKSAPNIQTLYQSLEAVGLRTLTKLVEKQNQSMEPFTCLVFDTLMAWGDKVAQSFGIPSVGFSTQSCAVSAIYFHINRGSLDVPESDAAVNMFGLPPMDRSDFPSIALKSRSYPPVIQFSLNQLSSGKTGWVLVNSFDELETEVSP
jgi:pathogen-inducible salicylic acid glucosyltransferase